MNTTIHACGMQKTLVQELWKTTASNFGV